MSISYLRFLLKCLSAEYAAQKPLDLIVWLRLRYGRLEVLQILLTFAVIFIGTRGLKFIIFRLLLFKNSRSSLEV